MHTRAFGGTGRAVPGIGYGTWQLGRDDRREAIAAIRRAVERGMTHVDTAEMYGSGHVEELVGEALDGLRLGHVHLRVVGELADEDFDGLIQPQAQAERRHEHRPGQRQRRHRQRQPHRPPRHVP